MRQERKPLATIAIPEYYRRQGEQRAVRPYQQEAMKALDHAVELGKRRFLMELPTGTGKTDAVRSCTWSDDDILHKIRAGEALLPEEEQRLADRLNALRYSFNEDNLRRAYRQPGGTLIDFIRAALRSFKLKSREEELTENFQA